MKINFGRLAAALLATTSLCSGAARAADLNVIGAGSTLITFDSATPGTFRNTRALTGLRAGETLIGIDARPASPRMLFGLGSGGQLYVINRNTAQAFAVGAPITLTGTAVGFDFNPSVDRIRVVTNLGQNLRLNPDTGAIAATDATVAGGVLGAAYSNNIAGGTPTTLYVITPDGLLATQGSPGGAPVSPNSGTLIAVGALGYTTNSSVGFDISSTGQALATLTNPASGVTSLYSINLATGVATPVGALSGATTYGGLTFAPTPFAQLGVTANQSAVGATLDNFAAAPTAGLVELFNALDPSPTGTSAGLAALTPASYVNLPEIGRVSAQAQDTAVSNHLRNVRGGDNLGAGGMTTSDGGKLGMFFDARVSTTEYDAAFERSQAKLNSANFVLGVDYALTPALVIGAFGGYTDGSAKLDAQGGHADSEGAFGGVYGSFGFASRFYVDGFASYTDADLDLRRQVLIGPGYAGVNTASTKLKTTAAALTAGATYDMMGFQVEPFVGLHYSRSKVDDFNEQGSSSALAVDEFAGEAFESQLGVKLASVFEAGGATLKPEFRIAWVHDFNDDDFGETLYATVQQPGLAPFAFRSTAVDDADAALVGAGLSVLSSDRFAVRVDYSGRFSEETTQHGLAMTVKYAF
ncbi:DUF4394 domain-containing protein [Caulobacter sp. DWP3-1-3b2]|uniref:DUF4394 domain-containing protein n=1 Tax=Caulobacter sp. DWP3-1-3b2 TaxID=2804643 RepID=UPI003CEF2706